MFYGYNLKHILGTDIKIYKYYSNNKIKNYRYKKHVYVAKIFLIY